MSKKNIIIAAAALVLIAAVILLAVPREVTLTVNGGSQTLRTNALSVAGALHQAGFQASAEDRLEPRASALLKPGAVITLDQAQAVTIVISPSGESLELRSALRRPADLLAEAGLTLSEHDRLTLNGLPIDPSAELPYSPQVLLEVRQAQAVTLNENGLSQTLLSSAATLGQALWEAGIVLTAADRVSTPLETPLLAPVEVEIERAVPVTITVDGGEISVPTAAATVRGALSEAGVSLHGMDYSQPGEDEPLPADRSVRVVRVREDIILQQQPIPFKSSFQPDPNTELDKRSIVTPGEFGVQVLRERVLYEDGVEVSRAQEDQWVAKEPRDQVVGYGTQPVVNTIDTPAGTLEYWRAVDVWATSYSPCRLGIPNYCNTQTASGMQLTQGIVAVTRAWYSWMAGQRVYIPGYGVAVVADVGGGIPGRYWVDLGYTDADYAHWSRSVTMYFLTPVPANIPWILP